MSVHFPKKRHRALFQWGKAQIDYRLNGFCVGGGSMRSVLWSAIIWRFKCSRFPKRRWQEIIGHLNKWLDSKRYQVDRNNVLLSDFPLQAFSTWIIFTCTKGNLFCNLRMIPAFLMNCSDVLSEIFAEKECAWTFSTFAWPQPEMDTVKMFCLRRKKSETIQKRNA